MRTLKSKNLITQGRANIAVASVKKLHTTRITAKTLQVSGVLRADKGVWVGNKKIVPLGEEVQALREELASMKEMLASLQERQQRR